MVKLGHRHGLAFRELRLARRRIIPYRSDVLRILSWASVFAVHILCSISTTVFCLRPFFSERSSLYLTVRKRTLCHRHRESFVAGLAALKMVHFVSRSNTSTVTLRNALREEVRMYN